MSSTQTIGIVGAGVAGLHLGFFLLKHGVSATIYSDRTPDQMRTSRLPSTTAFFDQTRSRERALGINFWDDLNAGISSMHIYVHGEMPLYIHGELEAPGLFVDLRMYFARLLEEFEARGGHVVIKPMDAEGVNALAGKHDLVVVSSGRGSLTEMFPRVPERSPYTEPQRRLFAGLVRGIRRPSPPQFFFNIVPGQGEVFENQMVTPQGIQSGLLIEAIPGSELSISGTMRYEDDPKKFDKTLLDLLEKYSPATFSRIDPDAFGVLRAEDMLQGGIVPTVRRGYSALPGGTFALAIGDVYIVNDPIVGQGANAASYSAWAAGEAIVEALEKKAPFDQAFCEDVEQRLWSYMRYVTEWSNGMLQPPPPHAIGLLVAASQNKALANAFANNFNTPQRNWEIFSNPGVMEKFIQSFSDGAKPA